MHSDPLGPYDYIEIISYCNKYQMPVDATTKTKRYTPIATYNKYK